MRSAAERLGRVLEPVRVELGLAVPSPVRDGWLSIASTPAETGLIDPPWP